MQMTETIAHALAIGPPRVAILVFLDFASAPFRCWLGFGPLIAGGHTWTGLGECAGVSDLEQPLGGSAPETSIALSGVDPLLLGKALTSEADWKGRPCTIYVQHFDEGWRPLDAPMALYIGFMDVMKISAPDEKTRRVDVSLEWVFARRALAPFGTLSNDDQQRLHPGDRFLEQVPDLQNKTVAWPIL